MVEERIEVKKQELEPESLIRILDYDIPGSKNLYVGLTKIKGISWAISNIACNILKIPKEKKIKDLSKDEIVRIVNFFNDPNFPDFFKNRRFDLETGKNKHFLGSDLDMKKEFDIKRLIKIRSYKGIRHASKLPVRGQRTRSHFRTKSQASGIKKKKK